MSRDHDELAPRPERVIILDADDPMTEIHGKFVWQEEHERVVDAVSRQAYADGYRAGLQAAESAPTQVQLRRRRTLADRLRLAVLVMLALLVLLMLPIIFL